MNRLPSSSASTPSIAFGSSEGIMVRKEGASTRARPTPVKQASSVPRIVCGLLKRYTASRLSASDDGLEAGSGESGTMAESACAHGAAAREQSGDNLSVAIEGRTAAGLKHEALLRQTTKSAVRIVAQVSGKAMSRNWQGGIAEHFCFLLASFSDFWAILGRFNLSQTHQSSPRTCSVSTAPSR
jgi:hypothetical protein